MADSWRYYFGHEPVIILDTEFLPPTRPGHRADIWELGLIRTRVPARLTTPLTTQVLHFFVDPGRGDRPTPYPTARTKVREEFTAGAGTFDKHVPRIARFCRGARYFAGWKVGVDRNLFLEHLRRAKATFPELIWIDVMRLASMAWDYPRNVSLQRVANERLRWTWMSQTLGVQPETGRLAWSRRSLQEKFEVEPWIQDHYAVADAQITSRLLHLALVELYLSGTLINQIPFEGGYLGSTWPDGAGKIHPIRVREIPSAPFSSALTGRSFDHPSYATTVRRRV